MAKENSKKKLLAILVVLVAASLIVDLISLNVLYKINKAESSSSASGELASVSVRAIDPCLKCDKNLQRCIRECGRKPTQECILGCNANYDSCTNDNNCI